ncbi:hypothetical protein ACRRTK_001940 [Alexandromys fortis]
MGKPAANPQLSCTGPYSSRITSQHALMATSAQRASNRYRIPDEHRPPTSPRSSLASKLIQMSSFVLRETSFQMPREPVGNLSPKVSKSPSAPRNSNAIKSPKLSHPCHQIPQSSLVPTGTPMQSSLQWHPDPESYLGPQVSPGPSIKNKSFSHGHLSANNGESTSPDVAANPIQPKAKETPTDPAAAEEVAGKEGHLSLSCAIGTEGKAKELFQFCSKHVLMAQAVILRLAFPVNRAHGEPPVFLSNCSSPQTSLATMKFKGCQKVYSSHQDSVASTFTHRASCLALQAHLNVTQFSFNNNNHTKYEQYQQMQQVLELRQAVAQTPLGCRIMQQQGREKAVAVPGSAC